MNPFARLIDPAEPVPQPHTMNGFVHVLADEIDPATSKPASHAGPKAPVAVTSRALCPIVGLPRTKLRYERDDSVCVVRAPHGVMLAEVYLPVVVDVTGPATVAAEKKKTEPRKRDAAALVVDRAGKTQLRPVEVIDFFEAAKAAVQRGLIG